MCEACHPHRPGLLCGQGYGAFSAGPSLILDRPLFYREYADGCYNAVTYYLHKFLEEAVRRGAPSSPLALPSTRAPRGAHRAARSARLIWQVLATITSCLFALLVWWACSLQGSLLVFLLAYYLTTMLAICLTYVIASVMPNPEASGAVTATYITTCMYFGGLYIVYDEIPTGWFWYSYTSFLRYAWGAFMNNHFSNATDLTFLDYSGAPITILDFYGMEGGTPTAALRTTRLSGGSPTALACRVREDTGLMGSAWACLGMLALLICVYSGLALAALGFLNHSAR